eukprot:TRINITY_DN22791_c0_g1_i1.p1 TRINITY_DN22791_c0_g1~~TRINITY_DN22791_c0_g1_i1.p1  ORF type:complete len:652 (+),score=136.90 TRINITY_DN22791_c0_g1_i1:127-2082(+)
MGCGASTASLAQDLQRYRDEVAELQKQLKESEANREELQRRSHKISSPSSGAGGAGIEDADSTIIAKDRVVLQVEESPISGSPQHEGSAVPPELISLPKFTPTAERQSQEEKADAQQEMKVEKKDTCEQVVEVQLPGEVVHEGETCEAPESGIRKDLAEESDKASTCTPASKPPTAICSQCFCEAAELYQDPTDLQRYCENCWIEYYGRPPLRNELQPLVGVEVHETWAEELLAQAWSEQILPGWPPPLVQGRGDSMDGGEEQWADIKIRIRQDICGPHAREQTTSDRPSSGEVLAGRYRVSHVVGEGHFTKAFLAHDLKEDKPVCVKRHRNLSVEALADLYVLGRRMEKVDVGGRSFPKLIDAFYDVAGFTVEALLEGQNCLSKAQSKPNFFMELKSLKVVATGALSGLALLDQAGIVHNDIKPDNLMWIEGDGSSSSFCPRVKIVDFGCARLDQREENGRNWALAEGGAGHLGKWAPEMCLRLPITHRGDIWGIAVALCELYCGRCVWRSEADTAEVVLAQGLSLCNLRDGVPASLLRRSPLDVRALYSPAPRHWPLRRTGHGQMETLRPSRWGIEQVLGHAWQDTDKVEFGQLLVAALVLDPAFRPSASQLLKSCRFAATKSSEGTDDEDDDEVELPATSQVTSAAPV